MGGGRPLPGIDNTLVVGPDSAIRSVADMDRPGVRIGALSGTRPEQNLSRLVTQAEVVRTATVAELVPLLRAGQVDALVSNRPIVLAFAAQVPGARVWRTATRSPSSGSCSRPAARRRPRPGLGRDPGGAGVRPGPRGDRAVRRRGGPGVPAAGPGRAPPDRPSRAGAGPAGGRAGGRAGCGGGGPAGAPAAAAGTEHVRAPLGPSTAAPWPARTGRPGGGPTAEGGASRSVAPRPPPHHAGPPRSASAAHGGGGGDPPSRRPSQAAASLLGDVGCAAAEEAPPRSAVLIWRQAVAKSPAPGAWR